MVNENSIRSSFAPVLLLSDVTLALILVLLGLFQTSLLGCLVGGVKTWCRAQARHHVDSREKFMYTVILPEGEEVRGHGRKCWSGVVAGSVENEASPVRLGVIPGQRPIFFGFALALPASEW